MRRPRNGKRPDAAANSVPTANQSPEIKPSGKEMTSVKLVVYQPDMGKQNPPLHRISARLSAALGIPRAVVQAHAHAAGLGISEGF